MNTTIAFIISSAAGLSTLIGSTIILINKKDNTKFIAKTMAFSSGVMFTLSILDLIPESISFLKTTFYQTPALLICLIFLTIGILISITIDKKIPIDKTNNLYKVGLVSMLAIIIHNIPEDCSCYVSR